MNGTNRLDLTIGHGAELLLTTGNGFAKTTTHGARNVFNRREIYLHIYRKKVIKEYQCGISLVI